MPLLAAKRVVSIFIASPGDLNEERRLTREVVEEINTALGRALGIVLQLVGWEDTLPGRGRPQALINPDVDACDLFIGMLWHRWGQPTGAFSSGFEEEFSRALSRTRQSGKPDMWLAFKRIEPDRAADPGEQLQRVLTFRRQQEAAREVLFKEFATAGDWVRQLRGWLEAYMADLAARILDEQSAPTERPNSASSGGGTALIEGDAGTPIPAQLQRTVDVVRELFAQPGESVYWDALGAVDRWDLVRLELFAKSALAFFYTADVIGVHDLNLLFQYREKVEFVVPETRVVFDSLIADSANTSPGWYWFSEWTAPELETILYDTAATGRSKVVRRRAFELIAFGRIGPTQESSRVVLQSALESDDAEHQRWALRALGAVGDREWLSAIERLWTAGGPVAGEAGQAWKSILVHIDPLTVLRAAAEHRIVLEAADLATLDEGIHEVPDEALVELMNSAESTARKWAIGHLLARGALGEDELDGLVGDVSPSVRELAYAALVEAGRDFTASEIRDALRPPPATGLLQSALGGYSNAEPERVIAALFRRKLKTVEEIDWYDIDAPVAYAALAARDWELLGNQVRRDLVEGFARVRVRSVEDYTRRFGGVAPEVIDSFTKFDDFISKRFRASALDLLAVHPEPQDIEIARRVLADATVALPGEIEAAASIVARFGEPSDAPPLLAYARTTVSGRDALVRAALAVAPGEGGAASTLLGGDGWEVRAALSSLRGIKPQSVIATAAPLLDDVRSDVRSAAVGWLARELSYEHLEDVLSGYMSRAVYYYDVVGRLDQLVYSPEPLRSAFRSFNISVLQTPA